MGSSHDDRFRRLVREHSPEVANYLRRRLYPLTAADLDDLVEETMLVVWRRLDDVPVDAERPWIIGVARNVLRNARRGQNRRRAFEASLAPSPNDPSAEEYVIADTSVREALRALNDDDREILMLNAWDGLEAGELAITLAITPNAAAVRLSRARTRFRDAFTNVEIS